MDTLEKEIVKKAGGLPQPEKIATSIDATENGEPSSHTDDANEAGAHTQIETLQMLLENGSRIEDGEDSVTPTLKEDVGGNDECCTSSTPSVDRRRGTLYVASETEEGHPHAENECAPSTPTNKKPKLLNVTTKKIPIAEILADQKESVNESLYSTPQKHPIDDTNTEQVEATLMSTHVKELGEQIKEVTTEDYKNTKKKCGLFVDGLLYEDSYFFPIFHGLEFRGHVCEDFSSQFEDNIAVIHVDSVDIKGWEAIVQDFLESDLAVKAIVFVLQHVYMGNLKRCYPTVHKFLSTHLECHSHGDQQVISSASAFSVAPFFTKIKDKVPPLVVVSSWAKHAFRHGSVVELLYRNIAEKSNEDITRERVIQGSTANAELLKSAKEATRSDLHKGQVILVLRSDCRWTVGTVMAVKSKHVEIDLCHGYTKHISNSYVGSHLKTLSREPQDSIDNFKNGDVAPVDVISNSDWIRLRHLEIDLKCIVQRSDKTWRYGTISEIDVESESITLDVGNGYIREYGFDDFSSSVKVFKPKIVLEAFWGRRDTFLSEDEYFAVSGGKTVGTTCKNLLGFENFTSVSVLTMKNCRSFFGTLEPLSLVTTLTALNLVCHDTGYLSIFCDLTPLNRLPQLKLLRMERIKGISGSLDPIYEITTLEYLEIFGLKDGDDKILMADISALLALPNLEELILTSYGNTKLDLSLDVDLSARVPRITNLIFGDCGKIERAYLKNFQYCDSLRFLNLRHSSNMIGGDLDDLSCLQNLEVLDLLGLSMVTGMLTSLAGLTNLRSLNISGLSLVEGKLSNLSTLTKLKRLTLDSCSKIEGELGDITLPELKNLEMRRCCEISGDLDSLKMLPKLEQIDIAHCRSIQGSLNVIEQLSNLSQIDFKNCSGINGVLSWKTIGKLSNLANDDEERVCLENCGNFLLPSRIDESFERNVGDCINLPSVNQLTGTLTPQIMSAFLNLETLCFHEDAALIPPTSFRVNDIKNSGLVNLIKHVGPFAPEFDISAKKLSLSHTPFVLSLEELQHLKQLTELDVSGCQHISGYDGLTSLTSLELLSLRGTSIVSLDSLAVLTKLTHLDIRDCEKMDASLLSLSALPKVNILSNTTAPRFGVAYKDAWQSLKNAIWRSHDTEDSSENVDIIDALENFFKAYAFHHQYADSEEDVNTFLAAMVIKAGVSNELLLLLATDHSLFTFVHLLITKFQCRGREMVKGDGRRACDLRPRNVKIRKMLESLGTFLCRYSVHPGVPIHRSKTCVVRYAFDTLDRVEVALKLMKNFRELCREVQLRNKSDLNDCVICVRGYHIPETLPEPLPLAMPDPELQRVSKNDEFDYPYVLVLDKASQSLYQLLGSQRLAGYNCRSALQIFHSCVKQTIEIHKKGIIHFDIKPRNILLLDDIHSIKLCDLDASMKIGERCNLSKKYGSSGYASPEVAQLEYDTKNTIELIADPSVDIWSLGVLLYELCAGKTLFRLDISNDALVDKQDLSRLFVWNTITDRMLDDVFAEADGAPASSIVCAKDLIRWCLKGKASDRPSLSDILKHPLLAGCQTAFLQIRPMRYFAFISHAQVDAASTAKVLYNMFLRVGIYCWYDMEQEKLTTEGMGVGVRQSDIFILLLTEHVLYRWFCQYELITALTEGKRLQLIIEEDERFHPFSRNDWFSAKSSFRATVCEEINKNHAGDHGEAVCSAIDNAFQNAVSYRRRDFEADAMLREVCLRNGLALPCKYTKIFSTEKVNVCLVYDRTRHEMLDIWHALTSSTDCLVSSSVQDFSVLLIFLTPGILEEGSETLKLLVDGLRVIPKESIFDRCILIQHEWIFDESINAEMKAAPMHVKDMIKGYESFTYRKPCAMDHPARHEFLALVDQILMKLNYVQKCIRDKRTSTS
jgi:serine/threonine protein kinase